MNVQENLDLIRNNFQSELNQIDEFGSEENHSLKTESNSFLQFKKRHIVTVKKNGLLIVDIFRAHQQIKYEEIVNNYNNSEIISQKLLHPLEVKLSASDIELCMDLKEDLLRLGVEIDQFSKDTIVVNSYPVNSENLDAQSFVESCIVSSIIEGFPNVILEMMSQNTNVISTKCAGGIDKLKGVITVEVCGADSRWMVTLDGLFE